MTDDAPTTSGEPSPRRSPWRLSGDPDPDVDEVARHRNHALSTDPDLAWRFRERFPQRGGADYDEMIRALGYVWDCSHDGTANVTGYRCAACGRSRVQATGVRARLGD